MAAPRLTEAQQRALHSVADGVVYMRWSIRPGRPQWMHTTHWQPVRAQPYERLRDLGLIEAAPAADLRSKVSITAAGREALR